MRRPSEQLTGDDVVLGQSLGLLRLPLGFNHTQLRSPAEGGNKRIISFPWSQKHEVCAESIGPRAVPTISPVPGVPGMATGGRRAPMRSSPAGQRPLLREGVPLEGTGQWKAGVKLYRNNLNLKS